MHKYSRFPSHFPLFLSPNMSDCTTSQTPQLQKLEVLEERLGILPVFNRQAANGVSKNSWDIESLILQQPCNLSASVWT